VTVVSEIVHVNVPLTPAGVAGGPVFTLTPAGITPPTRSIPIGGTVEWASSLPNTASAADVMTYTENPVAQAAVTARNGTPLAALTSVHGFDSGMLAPGQVYRRQFTQAGTYTFADGAGHTGTVVVESADGPTVTMVYPARGATLGGAPVTITGTNFAAGAVVSFGGVPAQAVTVRSSTAIVAVIPAHLAGVVSVDVTNTDAQEATLTDGFAFVDGIPTFIDDPLQAGVTRIKAVHLTELRQRIDELRVRDGLGTFGWTDPALIPGVSVVKRAHLVELRAALDAVYVHESKTVPTYATPTPVARTTIVAADHVAELRAAVVMIW